ncbi:LamG-like jellyroll fold domain-containing protein [uncultured Massilia sp.]|uniref:LamG-like jellyroll fold domain-containing protein n=1 Tax=uncultured Massilia sp. TaxID=169973 RepID=UPI00258C945F|nr:LamG-like jellyroll fold domain-containing protein [uncultured Massilia sp.]
MKFHSLMAAALLSFSMQSHAGLIHHFTLNGSLADSAGSTSLVALGGELRANDYLFGADQGLRLDARLGGVYTIDLRFRFDSLATYGRIVDFKNLTGDSGFYAVGDGLRLYSVSNVGGHLDAGVDSRLTLTRDAQNMFKVYQNGELVVSVSDTSGIADFGQNVAHFFRDNDGTNSGEANPGAVDYIRIYDVALSLDEVRALTPPDAQVAEPGPLGLMGVGLALLGFIRRRADGRAVHPTRV